MAALLLALLLAGCAASSDAPASDAPPAPPIWLEGTIVASAGTPAQRTQSVGEDAGEFVVPQGARTFEAIGNWSASAATGVDVLLEGPDGRRSSAGTIGPAASEGSVRLRVADATPGTWQVTWRAAGAAADIAWTLDVRFS